MGCLAHTSYVFAFKPEEPECFQLGRAFEDGLWDNVISSVEQNLYCL